MVRKVLAVVAWVGLSSACGSGDSYRPTFSEAEAGPDACPSGGKLLLVDGAPQMTVCNGADGKDGATGAEGAKGNPGIKGDPGDSGAQGATGATGATGPSGLSATAKVAQTISCISDKRASLVGIQCTDGVTGEFGSGTVTQSGQVFTAGHVVANIATKPCSIFDLDWDHVTMIGTVLESVPDSVYDAAVLNVSWVGAAPAGVAAVSRAPGLGEMVVSTGHPDAVQALQYSAGFVTAINISEMGSAWTGAFMADYSSSGGGSGGAVFNADCEWIGIHVGGFTDGFETSIALPF